MKRIQSFLPLLLLAFLGLGAYFSGWGDFLSFDQLKLHREAIVHFVKNHPWQAPLIFMTLYTLSTALSIPGGTFLSVLGGFLFPQPFSTLYVVLAATLGACLIFLAASTALGESLRRRADGLLVKLQSGFQQEAASYLLFLRLVPVFPFWLVNLAPAFFGVSLFTFVWTTFLGIIPGAFVLTQAGAGLGAILDSGASLSLDTVLNTQVKIALIALGLLALIPVLLKRWKKPTPND